MSNRHDNQTHNKPKNQPAVLPTKPATPPVIEAAKPGKPAAVDAATPALTPTKQVMPESDAANAAAAPIVTKPAVESTEKAKPAVTEPAKH